jgi:acetolactate synthase-1/2/3 large subunit
MRADELPRVLARAFAVFESSRPGPVHIEIPLDVIVSEAAHVAPLPWPRVGAGPAASAAVEELAGRLAAAQSPCLMVGGGAVAAAAEIATLAEQLDIPVVTTVNAKGVLPPQHPLLAGASPSLQSVRQFLADSDVVIAVGTEFGETDYDMLFLGPLPRMAWLARIDIDPAQLCRNQRCDLALCGDARETLRSLLLAAGGTTAERPALAAERVQELRARVRREEHFHEDLWQFFKRLRETLPGLCLVGDSTLPTYYAVWQYDAPATRRYFHSATGGGTLGYAIPAAIGARRALPAEVPVVALIGDGAAQFTFMELAAAVQEKLPVTVLLWNNAGYREIRAGMLASDVAPIGVDIDTPDFPAAARALGCNASRAHSLEELAQQLRDAAAALRPTLIELQQGDFLESDGGGWY